MNWLDKIQVSKYCSHCDTRGQVSSLQDVLFSDFGIPHMWIKDNGKDAQRQYTIEGPVTDIQTLMNLRKLNPDGPDYDKLSKPMKATLQGYTPAGLLESRKKGEVKVNTLSGLMQLDFDYGTCKYYDIEEIKAAIFDLPFIALCSLSCTGNGFYALAMIEEPERLLEYAEHCFVVLDKYGLTPDTSKGRNVSDLRYLSYDSNLLIKDDPTPLKIKRFISKKKSVLSVKDKAKPLSINTTHALLNKALNEIASAVNGSRFETVRKWSYCLGGVPGENNYLDKIKTVIKQNTQYTGYEDHCYEAAENAFAAGKMNPLSN